MKHYVLSLLMVALLVLSACSPTITPTEKIDNPLLTPVEATKGTYLEKSTDISQTRELQSFSSLEEYEAFVSAGNSGSYYGGIGLMARSFGMDDVAVDMAVAAPMPTMAEEAKVASFDGAQESDFSQTNNQVAGVDEADIIKTDGNYIYTVTGKTLFIVSAGEDATLISKTSFDGNVDGIFIYEDTIAVFGSEYNDEIYDTIGFFPQNGMTYFHIYDISDKENLELVKEYSFEGNYFNARMIDGQVYFVVQDYPMYRPVHPLPVFYEDGMTKEVALDRIMWYPGRYDNSQLVTTHSIDLTGNKDVESLSIAVDNTQTLYMSEQHIFLVGNEYINEYEIQQDITKKKLSSYLTQEDKELIGLIAQSDNRLLSQGEKENKIMNVYYQRMNTLSSDEQKDLAKKIDSELADELKKIKFYQYTTLYKLSVDKGSIEYVASGKVPGRIVNQFSLDEHEDNLRIATTVDARWSRYGQQSESYTNVYVLNDDLQTIGELTELAPTERIYSTRFIQDRLYMVTFKQVDPFFVIDLSNPTKPKELGQLKIPGFSRYLHPYDENYLIGIGQDATELGRTTGLKISLFNVEDVENPVEVAKYVTDERYASSSALYEHKAFLFSKEKNLLVIPAYSWGYDDTDRYNGAFVFDISPEGIELRGLIDHSTGDSYFQQVERSLYIDDLLYTKSPYLLRINSIDTLEGVKNIELKEKIGIPVY